MSAEKRIFWGVRTFCVVTGASRGIGQEIAYQFAQKFAPGSLMLLLSRTEKGLEKTKSMITSVTSGVDVDTVTIDLSRLDSDAYYRVIEQCLHRSDRDFDHAIIVHNAASISYDLPMTTADDIDVIQTYMNFNVYGAMLLNAQFLKHFPSNSQHSVKRTVIQTSSISSMMPIPNFGLYCMSKAARNMYFQTLAVDDPTLDVFSYGPGPVNTELARESAGDLDPETMEKFMKQFTIPRAKTVSWLVDVLTEGNYQSGEFRDIYTMEQYQNMFQQM